LKKLKEAKLHEQFPNEVDIPMNVPARVKFQNFRTTKWDPKENLPYDYGRIYQFPNFRTMIKQIESEQEYNQHKQDRAQVQLFLFKYMYISSFINQLIHQDILLKNFLKIILKK
ncbi:unnamed protein product, partial [Rotaria sp. Silwood1]